MKLSQNLTEREITYLKTAQILMLVLTLMPAHFYAVAHLLPLTYW